MRTAPSHGDCSLQLLTWNDADGKNTLWHSSAHLMAEALEALYPGIKFGIGPPIENGFYYDVDLGDRTIGEGEFAAIEAKMKELAGKKNQFERKEVPKAEAIAFFTEKGDEYKLELLEGLNDGEITFYQQGDFVDLCRGPHIPDTSYIKAAKVMSVAGAYWRGDEKRKQLTRLYGITFPKQKELDGIPRAAGGGQEARPPQAGQGTGPVHLQREGGSRPSLVAAQGYRICASA